MIILIQQTYIECYRVAALKKEKILTSKSTLAFDYDKYSLDRVHLLLSALLQSNNYTGNNILKY